MGGFSPAIGMLGGGELGGDGVQLGETIGLKGAELGVGIVVVIVRRGGM